MTEETKKAVDPKIMALRVKMVDIHNSLPERNRKERRRKYGKLRKVIQKLRLLGDPVVVTADQVGEPETLPKERVQ